MSDRSQELSYPAFAPAGMARPPGSARRGGARVPWHYHPAARNAAPAFRDRGDFSLADHFVQSRGHDSPARPSPRPALVLAATVWTNVAVPLLFGGVMLGSGLNVSAPGLFLGLMLQ